MSDFGSRPAHLQQKTGGANFDTTTGSGNRDPWNNRIVERNNNTNNSDGNTDDSNKNDGSIDDKTIDNIWEAVKEENSTTTTHTNTNTDDNQQTTRVDPQKQLDNYLTGVGITPITFTEEEKEQIQNGDFSVMTAKMHQQVVTAHTKALAGSKTMIDEAVKSAVAEATKSANSTFSGQQSLLALNNALPYTKDKAISPVAQTIMQKFLDRGMSTEDAIKGVDKYFNHIGNKMAGNSVNKNRAGNFSNSGNNRQDETPEGGWLNILSSHN